MTTIRIKLPTIEQVKFTLEVEQDDTPVRGNAVVSGDDALNKQVEDEIIKRLDSGDVWAWAAVCIKASWRGLEGTNWLGCCNYEDEADFKRNSDYYQEMKDEAYDDLIAQIKALK